MGNILNNTKWPVSAKIVISKRAQPGKLVKTGRVIVMQHEIPSVRSFVTLQVRVDADEHKGLAINLETVGADMEMRQWLENAWSRNTAFLTEMIRAYGAIQYSQEVAQRPEAERHAIQSSLGCIDLSFNEDGTLAKQVMVSMRPFTQRPNVERFLPTTPISAIEDQLWQATGIRRMASNV